MATKRRASFDPKSFLAKIGEGRSIGRYRKDEVVFSQGDPADAVFYIQKGQVKHLDEAYIYLARSYAAQKNYPEAKKALEQLKSAPGASPRVVKLWQLYGDTLGKEPTK